MTADRIAKQAPQLKITIDIEQLADSTESNA
jgi:hypothetical protein